MKVFFKNIMLFLTLLALLISLFSCGINSNNSNSAYSELNNIITSNSSSIISSNSQITNSDVSQTSPDNTTQSQSSNISSQEKFSPLALPSKIYAFVGQPIKLYFLNLVKYNSMDNIVFKVDSENKGTAYTDRWEYTPQKAETINLTIAVYDRDNNILNKGTTKIEIKDKTQKDSLSILIIGDSTIAANIEPQTVLSLANNNNYSLTMLGTEGKNLNKHEGKSGYTAKMFVETKSTTSCSNPFYNPNTKKFDFSYYMQSQSYPKIDCVSIQLGINDLTKCTSTQHLNNNMKTYFENMEFIINNIHSYDSNIKIIWNLILPCTVEQEKFNEQYGENIYKAERCKSNTYTANLKIIEKYSNLKNVFIAPTNASLDTVKNMEKGGVGAIHPSAAGYTEIGTLLYSFIRAIN
ncbi:MAG: SGNH/GDSL hydrolase family protein [Ruminococcaceae bacterium]|nr:SGNH/GDSL hydrolase family protein [Oscillospiraceae bacterium]